jgi:hypothetical protein
MVVDGQCSTVTYRLRAMARTFGVPAFTGLAIGNLISLLWLAAEAEEPDQLGNHAIRIDVHRENMNQTPQLLAGQHRLRVLR